LLRLITELVILLVLEPISASYAQSLDPVQCL
jgi:hypothetical protein